MQGPNSTVGILNIRCVPSVESAEIGSDPKLTIFAEVENPVPVMVTRVPTDRNVGLRDEIVQSIVAGFIGVTGAVAVVTVNNSGLLVAPPATVSELYVLTEHATFTVQPVDGTIKRAGLH